MQNIINNQEKTEEIWKNIEGYEGLYQVSNLGRIKSLGNNATRKEKILKFWRNNYGYLIVALCKEGKRKHFLVHRLVANAFLPNTNHYALIDHLDGNNENNRADNLSWYNLK